MALCFRSRHPEKLASFHLMEAINFFFIEMNKYHVILGDYLKASSANNYSVLMNTKGDVQPLN